MYEEDSTHNLLQFHSDLSAQICHPVSSRKKSRDSIIKIKQILSRLMAYIECKPMRIKIISREIQELLQKENPTKTIVEDTIKKRIYDVILVMNGVGLILQNSKKEFYVTEEERRKTKFPLFEKRKKYEDLQTRVNTKKLLIREMQILTNALEKRVLMKVGRKVKTKVNSLGMLGLLAKTESLETNDNGQMTKISGITEIFSNLELLSFL